MSLMITISPTCLFMWTKCTFVGLFARKKIPPDYPWKTQGHDHQWADLVMA